MSLGKVYLHISTKRLVFKMLQSNILKRPKPNLDERRDDPGKGGGDDRRSL